MRRERGCGRLLCLQVSMSFTVTDSGEVCSGPPQMASLALLRLPPASRKHSGIVQFRNLRVRSRACLSVYRMAPGQHHARIVQDPAENRAKFSAVGGVALFPASAT